MTLKTFTARDFEIKILFSFVLSFFFLVFLHEIQLSNLMTMSKGGEEIMI